MAERAVRLDVPGIEWSAGAPEPVVVAGEQRTLFAFYRDDSVVHGEDEIRVAEFVGCVSFRFGFPNDEVLHGHPLWGKGLDFYALHEVEQSSWLEGVRSVERSHPESPPQPFGDVKHFVLTFHDSVLEALARQVVPREAYQSMHAAMEAMTRDLDSA